MKKYEKVDIKLCFKPAISNICPWLIKVTTEKSSTHLWDVCIDDVY